MADLVQATRQGGKSLEKSSHDGPARRKGRGSLVPAPMDEPHAMF